MLVSFETMTAGGEMGALETVEMPRVPVKGETIVFRGPEYGGTRKYHSDEASMFEVIDVQWEIDKSDGEPNPDVTVTCYLRVHEQDEQATTFQARCVCREDHREVDEGDPDTCGSCRGIAWWNKDKK